MIRMAFSHAAFAETIAARSVDARAYAEGDGWVVEAARLIVDRGDCAAALGRPLTTAEREELMCRMVDRPRWRVWRHRDLVIVEPYRPTSLVGLRLPMGLADYVKREAMLRGMTNTDFLCLVYEWFALTWGDGEEALKESVEAKVADLHRWTGPRPIVGAVDEERTKGKHRQTRRHPLLREGRNGMVSEGSGDGD